MGKNKKKKPSINSKLMKIQRTEDSKRARDNLLELNKPRKSVNKSFTAKYDGEECPKCFTKIAKGDTVRYDENDVLVHVRHAHKEVEYKFCNSCFLTLPCECEN